MMDASNTLLTLSDEGELLLHLLQRLLHGNDLAHLRHLPSPTVSPVPSPAASTAVTVCVTHLWLSAEQAGSEQLWRPAAEFATWRESVRMMR